MNTIDIIPLALAIILLISFIIHYWNVYKNNNSYAQSKKDNWPPYKSSCPDYWKSIGNNTCENTHNIGVPECLKNGHQSVRGIKEKRVSFQDVSEEDKCSWSKKCEVPWEGVDTLGGCTA